MKENRRSVWSWALYDWANSAYATTVMAGFSPSFLKNIGLILIIRIKVHSISAWLTQFMQL